MVHITLSVEDMTSLEMVGLAYRDVIDVDNTSNRCLHFRICFDSHKVAFRALEVIESYGRFDAERTIKMIKNAELPEKVRIWVGREYSPVIYFQWLEQPERVRLRKAMEMANADEIIISEDIMRVWWD